MLQWDDKTTNRLVELTTEFRSLLENTSTSSDGTWLDLYQQWSKDNPYEFIIYLQDGFKEKPPKEILYYDSTDSTCVMLFDALSMSVFICEAFVKYTRQIIAKVIDELHPDNKLEIIRNYFLFIDNSTKFDDVNNLLENLASESAVLQGAHPIDIAAKRYFLQEMLEKYSVESIYLLFTYWRISSDQNYLSAMIASTVKYIRTYYKEYVSDENMHLDWPIERESTIQQLNILSRWFEVICYYADISLDEYKKRKWFISVDALVDDLSFPPFITLFEMHKYKYFYPDLDNTTVLQKGKYFHTYGVWIKTVDVLNITSQTASIIYNKTDEDINPFGVSRNALLELSDNLKKLKEHLSGLLFTHKEFYYAMRQKYSFPVLDTYEQNARKVDSSVDELIQFTEGILSSDINTLLQSKRQFLSRLSGFLSEDKERILDEYITRVIEKIKDEIRKLNIYSELYRNVTQDFNQYAQNLLAFPDIFCSLASAEYLYAQYIVQQQPDEKFDYSCISILYYMALEDFANKLLYTSYVTNILDPNAATIRQNYVPYVSHPTLFWDKRNRCYKRTCEIGNLGYLFNNVNQETVYKNYIQGLYPNIDLSGLVSFGSKLINIAPRRNEAAHGGTRITYNDVCIDKGYVYNSNNTYRGLIMELFSIIF